jgi:hypothetical protein
LSHFLQKTGTTPDQVRGRLFPENALAGMIAQRPWN